MWLTETEALAIANEYPYPIPSDYGKWLSLAFIRLSNDSRYSFPTVATEKMKTALSLYAVLLPTEKGVIDSGVSEFSIGRYSQKFSEQALGDRYTYPRDILALLSEYRAGRNVMTKLSRTYPAN